MVAGIPDSVEATSRSPRLAAGTVKGGDPQTPVDTDGDGSFAPVDCDEGNAAIHSGAADTCGNAIDEDCSGTDAACPSCGDSEVAPSGCVCEAARRTDGVCCADTWYADGYCCAGIWQVAVCDGNHDPRTNFDNLDSPFGVNLAVYADWNEEIIYKDMHEEDPGVDHERGR
ncbi:MAG: MopE-related protein, partial [Myxococcota bacterium]